MKTLMIGLCLGLTSLMYSQNFTKMANDANPGNEVALKEVVVSSLKNAHYFNLVNDPTAPSQAKHLEYEVGKYDIKSATVYSKNINNYEVKFESNYGSILASFSGEGELLNSNEKFEGIRLPEVVRISLRDTYPDWRLNTTEYRVKYNLNKDIKRLYEVQLIKDGQKMNLKVDCNGLILNPKNL
ncbi:hypothetical protein ES711_02770 [Gelidibacter salicanalis]|uniref:Nicotinate-nucleotide adenylyltransferase n=1 Tax=Gelidibacter salicanalis TaxID=291193 RepID=A0A5C7AYR0_9FLAO|nr:hypothetical protein [Gelidibacter salicanalis]TXE10842.1 hypothetical protein ES711_02770 [Gelidibacter salicanalis]